MEKNVCIYCNNSGAGAQGEKSTEIQDGSQEMAAISTCNSGEFVLLPPLMFLHGLNLFMPLLFCVYCSYQSDYSKN